MAQQKPGRTDERETALVILDTRSFAKNHERSTLGASTDRWVSAAQSQPTGITTQDLSNKLVMFEHWGHYR